MSHMKDFILFHDDFKQAEGADAAETALRQKRSVVLATSEVAAGYLRRLDAKRVEVDAQPAADVEDDEIGTALADAAEKSESSAKATWHYTEAVLTKSDSSQEDREAAQHVRDAFIPRRSEINLGYTDTAALAKERAPKVEALAADLDRFPVPGGGTLKRWAQDLIDAGNTIEALLGRRSLLSTQTPDRSPRARLRSEFSGLITRFRAALGDEIKEGIVPPEADALVFGYLDRLVAERARQASARAARKDVAAPQG